MPSDQLRMSSPPRLVRAIITALLFTFILGRSQAWGHEWSRSLHDPEGRAYAQQLVQALAVAKGDAKDRAFLELFLKDPNLSKRAYVAIVSNLQEEQPTATAELALLMATLIKEKLGDPLPLENLTGTRSMLELTAYLDTLRPALSEGRYLADRSHPGRNPKAFEAFRPFHVKAMRAELARILANQEVMIRELDSFSGMLASLDKTLVAQGQPPMTEAAKQDQQNAIAMLKLAVLAEVGLLDQFQRESEPLLRGEINSRRALAVLLAGFRAAYLQNRVEQAQWYVREARSARSVAGAPSNPVLEYAVRTAEYRLKRLQGYNPGEAEALAEFHKAWSALDSYQPMVDWRQDQAWVEGRQASRDWIDELRVYPKAAVTAGHKISGQSLGWLHNPEGQFLMSELSGDQGLLHTDETMALYTVRLACIDQVTYVAESLPESLDSATLLLFADELRAMVSEIYQIPGRLGVEAGAYDLNSSGLVAELQARAGYLQAAARETPEATRIAMLKELAMLSVKSGDGDFALRYLLACGKGLAALGQHEDAVTCWKEAVKIAGAMGFSRIRLEATSLLAKEASRRKDWESAGLYAEQAAQIQQAIAPLLGVRSAEGKAAAQAGRAMTDLSVQAAVAADDPTQALAAITRGQQLQSASLQMEGKAEARAEVRQDQQQEGQLAAMAAQVQRLETMPASATRNELLAGAQTLLADTRAKFLADTRQLRQKYPNIYGRVLKFDPLNLPSIQKSLPADLAVLQYFPTDDALYIFVVTQNSVRLRQVAILSGDLEKSVQSYTRAIRRAAPGDAAMMAESAKLYASLIGPLKDDIASSETLVLIPTGRLNILPFASLADASGVPLGQDYAILELAKSTDLVRMAGETPKRVESLVAFANATGDLPAAALEGDRIAALFPNAKLFKGQQATRDAFAEFGSQADALHLATHGEWNIDDSLANYLKMANQQKVSQEDIFELPMEGTSIVVLSACNTAMGDGGEASYVASLAEAFWIAGSQSVVASLWAVNDESTSLLMTEFYKALKAGDSKAEALRKAQMLVRSDEKFAHPYYWSGFVLFGDWR